MGNSPNQLKSLVEEEKAKIMFFGDSLTSGYNIQPGKRYTDVFQNFVNQCGMKWEVINSGKIGDTILGSMERLQIELKTHLPHVVCVCLGGNDLFERGYNNVPVIKQALFSLITKIKDYAAIPIVINIMPLFSDKILELESLVPEVNKRIRFFHMYEEVAKESGSLYVRSIFSGFPLIKENELISKVSSGNFTPQDMFEPDYFLDPVHPTEKGHFIMGRNLFLNIHRHLFDPGQDTRKYAR